MRTVSYHSKSSEDPECQLGPANHLQGIMGLTAEAILHSEKDFFPREVCVEEYFLIYFFGNLRGSETAKWNSALTDQEKIAGTDFKM